MATRTTLASLTPKQLREEVLQRVPRAYGSALVPGAISRALLEDRGINCPSRELIDCLSYLHREGSVEMIGTQGSSLNDIDVRFYRRYEIGDAPDDPAEQNPDHDHTCYEGCERDLTPPPG